MFEKYAEAAFYAIVIFVCGTFNNIFLFAAILNAARNTHVSPGDGWLSVTYWPAACAVIAFIFITAVDIMNIYRISTNKQSN
ncbi:hypothetical protein ACVQ8P_03925 [Dellaglioa sp. BT-FLS60]